MPSRAPGPGPEAVRRGALALDRSFDSILAAARAGAEWAWTAIYDELSPVVLGYLRARGADDPEELTGEVFLQVVRDLSSFAGDARGFRAWVLTIAHRRLLDDRRRRGRRPVAPAPEETLVSAAPHGDVRDDVMARGQAERVRAVLAGLPPDQEAVLLLRILGDMTIDEVARAVGKRPGAVKALQRRGLARIEKALRRGDVTL